MTIPAVPHRRVLLIAFHYPPAYGSGVQRILAFSRQLREFGWHADVLTIRAGALPDRDPARLADIPEHTEVIRAWGFDTARELAVFGKYPTALGLPDRWTTWRLGGLFAGLRYVRRHRPRALVSSFPIATAHAIGHALHRWCGVPWVADFRDPMAQDEYPQDKRVWCSYKHLEEKVIRDADRLVFTAPAAQAYYRKRYPALGADRCRVIYNGYEDEVFDAVRPAAAREPGERRLKLLHSGLLYPWERDPRPFFEALAELHKEGFWRRYPAQFVLRASGFDDYYRPVIAAHGLVGLVELAPRMAYGAAIAEMCASDALLLFQAANSNFQIPAKAFEYLRAGRPIFAVVDPNGDSAAVLRATGGSVITSIDSAPGIVADLRRFIPLLARAAAPVADPEAVKPFARREGSRQLAHLLDGLTGH